MNAPHTEQDHHRHPHQGRDQSQEPGKEEGRQDQGGHQAHHGSHHHTDVDWEAMGDQLETSAEMRAPFVEEAAAWLRGLLLEGGFDPDTVRRVLDVGSGPGVSTALLARAFPDAPEVVAVDGAPGLLERARARAVAHGLADRVSTRRAELPADLDALGAADLIWTSDVIHHIGDQQAALETLGGSLRPGGLLAVVERGLPQRYLPRDIGTGRPGLLARLDAVQEDAFAQMRADLPGHTRVVEDWPAMLAGAGLTYAGTRTFLTELPAPLEPRVRTYLHAVLTRQRAGLGDRLTAEDVAALDVLLDEDSAQGILHRPDAFYIAGTTLHVGRA